MSSPRIFDDLSAPPTHGPSPADIDKLEELKAEGRNVFMFRGRVREVSDDFAARLLETYKEEQEIVGEPTEDQVAAFKEALPDMVIEMYSRADYGAETGPDQCHDTFLWPLRSHGFIPRVVFDTKQHDLFRDAGCNTRSHPIVSSCC